MSASPEGFQGHIVIVAHITAAPGQGDEVERLVSNVRDFTASDAEPGALVYRVSRFNELFVNFEEYANLEAIAKHQESEPFKELVQATQGGAIAKLEYAFYKEF